jgi:hypothetical protein
MADGSYERLLAWSKKGHETLKVDRVEATNGSVWSISIMINDPVLFSAHGRGATIDDAAGDVIEQLETVGASVS